MKRVPFTALLVVVVLVGVGIGAGYGAWERGRSAPRVSPTAAAAPDTAPGAGGVEAAARPTVGTVQTVSGKDLTVQTPGGAATRVTLADDTIISRLDTGALSDLTVGAAVTVVGQKQGDSVTASSVEIGGAGSLAAVAQFAQGGQRGQGGQAGASGPSAAGASMARLSGKVDSVAAEGFTLATDSGQTKVIVPAGARVQKVTQATAADIKEGVGVQVTGDAGADGAVAAKSVLILPAGMSGGQARPGN